MMIGKGVRVFAVGDGMYGQMMTGSTRGGGFWINQASKQLLQEYLSSQPTPAMRMRRDATRRLYSLGTGTLWVRVPRACLDPWLSKTLFCLLGCIHAQTASSYLGGAYFEQRKSDAHPGL